MGQQIALFIESQLMRHYPDLIAFVKATEPALAEMEEAGRGSGQGPPPGVDVRKMEQVVKQFAQKWKSSMDAIHHHVMASFVNFSNGMAILKQVLTQLLLYYTRLQKIIDKSFPQQRPAFVHELVSNTTILMEIKQYQKSF